jgi:hypothetical protein
MGKVCPEVRKYSYIFDAGQKKMLKTGPKAGFWVKN